jgi:lipoprotein-anchoring transpeptidase ErfK/SrfK
VKVPSWTPENYPNLVLLLQQRYERSGWWVQVRLSTLPNGRLGWLPRRALGAFRTNTTHLYVNRAMLTATLQKDGETIFTTSIGVGKPYWPTPRGEFYIREKILGFRDPMYGPVAYGTSARSAVLTDWPGGGFIGVHGTNQPGILPGRVSHGCIRMRNAAILTLARLLPVGTPLTIS